MIRFLQLAKYVSVFQMVANKCIIIPITMQLLFLLSNNVQPQFVLLILDYSQCGSAVGVVMTINEGQEEVQEEELSDSTFTAPPGHTAPSQGNT